MANNFNIMNRIVMKTLKMTAQYYFIKKGHSLEGLVEEVKEKDFNLGTLLSDLLITEDNYPIYISESVDVSYITTKLIEWNWIGTLIYFTNNQKNTKKTIRFQPQITEPKNIL